MCNKTQNSKNEKDETSKTNKAMETAEILAENSADAASLLWYLLFCFLAGVIIGILAHVLRNGFGPGWNEFINYINLYNPM